MSPTGRALAAAALAAAFGCGGSLPSPVAHPPVAQRPAPPLTPAHSGVQVPQPASSATATLSGIVIAAADRKPLARARVTIESPALSEPRVAITGSSGAFEFRSLPAGAYTVSATRTGYAPHQSGARRSSPAAAVPVAIGQRVAGIEVALEAAGVIAGQILDEDKQPFAGARVDALVSRMADNQSTLVTVASAASDDQGRFRIAGLPAGQYYVSAFDPAFANVGNETGPLTYTATYYPGTPYAEQAARVAVVPGIEPALTIVFSLAIVRPARVSGLLTSLDGRHLINGAVLMSPVHPEGLPAVPAGDVVILPGGTFAFRNVPPGRYLIRARAEVEPHGTMLFATLSVTAEGRDIEGLTMTLVPGASVAGTLQIEAITTPRAVAFSGVRIRASSADGSSFGDSLTGAVGPDGAFRIRGLMAGGHYLRVEGLPEPWVLKQVTHRGQDITDMPLEVESRQEYRDLRITMTDAATDVSGMALERGRPAPDALVLFIPASQQFWSRTSRRFGLLRADANGRYRIRGLPDGEYRAIATYDIDESEIMRRDVLQELYASATPLSLAGRERRALDLPLVSLAAARRTDVR